MLLVVAAAIALPALLDTGPGTKDVGLTGATPAGLTAAVQAQGDAVDTTIRIHHYDTRADGEAAVRDGDIDVLVVDARQLEWRKRADEQLKAVVTGAIQLVAVRDRAEAAGIDPDELLAIVEPVPVTNIELGQVEGRSPDDETAAFIMTIVLFFAISTYGAMVLSGVVEEKSSRTVEVLLARMPARNLLAGKIAGIGLLGLGPDRRDRDRRARRRVARRLLRRPRRPRQRHRLGGRVVRARLRPLRHRVRHPRIARVTHRRRIERHRPGLDHPRPRVHGVLRRDRQRRHHLGAARLVVPRHRAPRHAQPHRHGRRDLVGSRGRRRPHPRDHRRTRRARRARLHAGNPPHRRDALARRGLARRTAARHTRMSSTRPGQPNEGRRWLP